MKSTNSRPEMSFCFTSVEQINVYLIEINIYLIEIDVYLIEINAY